MPSMSRFAEKFKCVLSRHEVVHKVVKVSNNCKSITSRDRLKGEKLTSNHINDTTLKYESQQVC